MYREEPTKPKAEKEGSQRQGRKKTGLLSDFIFLITSTNREEAGHTLFLGAEG